MHPSVRNLLLLGTRDQTLDLDFVNGTYKVAGAPRAQGYFSTLLGTPTFETGGLKIDSGDRLALPDLGWFNPNEGTFEIEWYADPTQAEGCIFSLAQGSGGTASRLEIYREPSLGINFTLVSNGSNIIANTLGAATTKYGRGLVSYKVGQRCSVVSGGLLNSSQANVYVPPSPAFDSVGIGYRARFGDAYFGIDAADRIRSIRYWAQRKTDAWMQARSEQGMLNLHLIGDSFVESGLATAVRTAYAERFMNVSFDGVGASSLADQKLRYDGTPQYYNRKLIILDGGLTDANQAAFDAIDGMAAHVPSGTYAWMQPGIDSSNPLGSGNHTAYLAQCDAISAHVGAANRDTLSAHYIPTLEVAKVANDGSANDLTDVANDIWPRSRRTDTLHPNAAGKTIPLASQVKVWTDSLGL